MNPPLRTKEDVAAIKEALADGTLDAIASDHAPHSRHDKDVEFDKASFGIIGLQTSLGLALTELIEKGALDWTGLIMKMSASPARILGINRGTLAKGAVADIAIIDPNREWVFGEEEIASKSINSPFIGWRLKGLATEVFVAGRLAYKR
jgi:dihydroorotase